MWSDPREPQQYKNEIDNLLTNDLNHSFYAPEATALPLLWLLASFFWDLALRKWILNRKWVCQVSESKYIVYGHRSEFLLFVRRNSEWLIKKSIRYKIFVNQLDRVGHFLDIKQSESIQLIESNIPVELNRKLTIFIFYHQFMNSSKS